MATPERSERSGAATDLTAALAHSLSARGSITSSCMPSDGFAAPTPFPVTPASSTAPSASPEAGGSFELDSDIYLAFGPMGSPLLTETVKKDAQFDAQYDAHGYWRLPGAMAFAGTGVTHREHCLTALALYES